MQLRIVGLGFSLLYSESFVEKLELVIILNVDRAVGKVALFISRLIKGLQDFSHLDYMMIQKRWGDFSFEIKDIGVIKFTPIFDDETGQKALAIDDIIWSFSSSRFKISLKEASRLSRRVLIACLTLSFSAVPGEDV